MRIIRVFLVSMIGFMLSGCWEGNEHYFKRIAAYRQPRNSLREKRSIPVIPSDWVVRADRSAVAWDNPDFDNGKKVPMRQYKFLTFTDLDSGTILEETDHYESGKNWVDQVAGTMNEYVRITYSFELERKGKNPWKAEALLKAGFMPKDITLSEAEEILKGWGINRLQ